MYTQEDNDRAVKRAEMFYAIIGEKLQELEVVHNKILENARRRAAEEQMDKLTRKPLSS